MQRKFLVSASVLFVAGAPASHADAVTILTGFLGAGKTTLLNYILTAQHNRKVRARRGDVCLSLV